MKALQGLCEAVMTGFSSKPLDGTTWPAFAALVERNGGVWGGCWCTVFHAGGVGNYLSPEQNRAEKQARVHRGAGVRRRGLCRLVPVRQDAESRSVSASFRHNGTLAMFEQAGFVRQRRLGKDRWLETAEVERRA